MPGPAAHLSIAELQTQRLITDPVYAGPVRDAFNNHKQHAALGSMGPDMLFWADWAEYTPVVNAIFDVYKTLDEIYQKLAAIWKPIQDAIDKVLAALTGGLSTEINETLAIVEGIINTAFIRLLTSQIDLLSLLEPDVQKKGSASRIEDWNWLDYTHHRWTGVFGRALVRRANASGDPSLRAYAYGWLSHITADVVGHAYVNTAVGGPYRSHWQRHFIQEKFMDTWVWGFYHTGGVTMPSSAMPGEIPFDYPAFTNVNAAGLHNFIDVGDNLPGPLQDLIAGALSDVYERRPHPNVRGTIPFLRHEHVNRAYQMLVTGLEIMTGKDRFIPRPQPPSVFSDWEPPTFPTPGGGSGSGSGGSSGGGFSLASLLSAIWDFIRDLFEYLHDLALWLISQVTFPLTYPVRYALYLIQLGLYEIYRQFRWALAISGFAYPDPDQLSHPLAQQFINPFGLVSGMPRREFPPEQDNSLFYPSGCALPPTPGCVEPAPASPGPYTRFPINYPFWFIEGEPSNPDIEPALGNSLSPEQTASITANLFPTTSVLLPTVYGGSLGSAVDFFLRRAREINDAGGGDGRLFLPDWNLDGDRGYGFLCWEVLRDTNVSPPADTSLEPPPPNGVLIQHVP